MEEYQFVVACEVLQATVSLESHDWQTGTTFVVYVVVVCKEELISTTTLL
jgi:hypothetical protein